MACNVVRESTTVCQPFSISSCLSNCYVYGHCMDTGSFYEHEMGREWGGGQNTSIQKITNRTCFKTEQFCSRYTTYITATSASKKKEFSRHIKHNKKSNMKIWHCNQISLDHLSSWDVEFLETLTSWQKGHATCRNHGQSTLWLITLLPGQPALATASAFCGCFDDCHFFFRMKCIAMAMAVCVCYLSSEPSLFLEW